MWSSRPFRRLKKSYRGSPGSPGSHLPFLSMPWEGEPLSRRLPFLDRKLPFLRDRSRTRMRVANLQRPQRRTMPLPSAHQVEPLSSDGEPAIAQCF